MNIPTSLHKWCVQPLSRSQEMGNSFVEKYETAKSYSSCASNNFCKLYLQVIEALFLFVSLGYLPHLLSAVTYSFSYPPSVAVLFQMCCFCNLCTEEISPLHLQCYFHHLAFPYYFGWTYASLYQNIVFAQKKFLKWTYPIL